MKPIITHFTDTDLYKLTMCCAILNCYPRAQVRYTFVDRNHTRYPAGFADELRAQVKALEQLRFTQEEEDFMRGKCYYLPTWFYTYLRGFRYDASWVDISQDSDGTLHVSFEGYWHQTVLLEVQVLAIISELHHTLSGNLQRVSLDDYYRLSFDKATRMLRGGLVVSDFGTRRRLSLQAEDTAVQAFIDAQSQLAPGDCPGRFVGTSNVYLAMKHGVTPVGTMAHEWIAAIAGMYGPQEANHIAMDMWQKTYIGSLGIYLYDTFGFSAFADNFSEHFARVFAGLRIDSGNEIEQVQKIQDKYKELGVDYRTKQIIFSNALDTDRALAIHARVKDRCIDSYGIGTHITCDTYGWGFTPMNIVIKLVAVKITEKRFFSETCKMSEDLGKYTGNPDTVALFKKLLHIPQ